MRCYLLGINRNFQPNVIFLAPVLNDYLSDICKILNETLLKVAEIGDNGNYLPNKWVPHTAIATALTSEQLKKAFDIIIKKFSAMDGKTNRILVAQCKPYKVIKTWDLTN